jgi:UDP-N-acetyl-D-glucosamine/UDP-N-acetyl-D-galactosamine dehydrogenase
MNIDKDLKIAIVGLGYVGLPLAVEFGKIFQTTGFDINSKRIGELSDGIDSTLEVDSLPLLEAKKLSFTSEINNIKDCNIYIVTVPTPITNKKLPDLSPLIKASKVIGKILKKRDLVIYESTVYPGVTEDVCVPVLEENSGLIFNKDFYCGYSPERINPGDKLHRLPMIKKITSGSTPAIAEKVDLLYKQIISAGTHKTSSIKIAEAAKVIENTQRDINIALINELAIIFNKLDIDTEAVLKAAATKWNFLSFKPGLVGGHCIGIDPYYLTYKASEVDYYPEVILAGRRLNDDMGKYIASQVTDLMMRKHINIIESNILIMGFTFKENCPDIRNTRVENLVSELKSFKCNVEVFDPWLKTTDIQNDFTINLIEKPEEAKYDAIILAVAHDEFKNLNEKYFRSFGKENHILYDIKYILNSTQVDGRL